MEVLPKNNRMHHATEIRGEVRSSVECFQEPRQIFRLPMREVEAVAKFMQLTNVFGESIG